MDGERNKCSDHPAPVIAFGLSRDDGGSPGLAIIAGLYETANHSVHTCTCAHVHKWDEVGRSIRKMGEGGNA